MCLIRYDTMEIYLRVKTLRGFPGSSAGKESACNAGNPGSIPESGRYPGEGQGCPLWYSWVSPGSQTVKNPPPSGRPGFDPWLGRSPGEGNGSPLQCSGLENSMNRGTWWATVHGVAERRTHVSDLRFHITIFAI